jgi:hypothetical protein
MTVTFTLSSLYTGATYVAGPFNIFAVTNTGSSTQVATGVTKEQLAAGHVVSGISDATTGGTINSTGTCTNSYPWYVSTPEPTATEPLIYTYNCFSGNCIQVEGTGGTYATLEDCQINCSAPPITYYCRQFEGGPCTGQASPCVGNQIVCSEFEQPA